MNVIVTSFHCISQPEGESELDTMKVHSSLGDKDRLVGFLIRLIVDQEQQEKKM